MPKRKNAFYFFMLNFKEEQMKNGVVFNNMKEVSEAAAPAWMDASPNTRAKFEAKAKQVHNESRGKTSTGVLWSDIKAMEENKLLLEKIEREQILQFCTSNTSDKTDVIQKVIYLIDVNSYCWAYGNVLVGEITLLRFSLKDGIIDIFHQVLNIGRIPRGYHFEVIQGAKEFGFDFPDESLQGVNKLKLLSQIMDYLRQNKAEEDDERLPILFTMPGKVPQVQNFISQMCEKAGKEDCMFRVYKLDLLLYSLLDCIRIDKDEGFANEWIATQELLADRFVYSSDNSCEYHHDSEKYVQCTLDRIKRWAYTLIANSLPLLPLIPSVPAHLPTESDLENDISVAAQDVVFECIVNTENENNENVTNSDLDDITPSPMPKKATKRAPDYINSALHKLDNIEKRARIETKDDDLDNFGKYVASSLRILNTENSIHAQNEIQAILSKYKLRELERSTPMPESPYSKHGSEDTWWNS